MHRIVVATVSSVLFLLLATISVLVTELYDRSFPTALGADASVVLDFGDSGLSAREAFSVLAERDRQWNLGLFKVAPDLAGDQSGEVFVALVDRPFLPETIDRFGDQPPARVAGIDSLSNSTPNGSYLLTGDEADTSEFRRWLSESSIDAEWTSARSPREFVSFVVAQGVFQSSLVAATALLLAVVLFWLSTNAKARALRILGGVPIWRVQIDDLVGLLAPVAGAAAAVSVATIGYVAIGHGWAYAPRLSWTLAAFVGFVVVAAAVCASVMSLAARPRAEMIARREPAVGSLSRISAGLAVVTFMLLLVSAASGALALVSARDVASDTAQWKLLANQVGLSLTGGSGDGEQAFQASQTPVSRLVLDAEERELLALSHSFLPESLSSTGTLDPYDHVALINPAWLDLVTEGDQPGATRWDQGARPVRAAALPTPLSEDLKTQLEIWRRDSTGDPFGGLRFYEYSSDTPLPVQEGGSGSLDLMRAGLVVMVPAVHGTFNDDFLVSEASTSNVSFTGVGAAEALVATYGLQGTWSVQYIAEEGIVAAQFAAYTARLQLLSLLTLALAMVIAAAVGATVRAMIRARHDFLLRVNGWRWSRIVSRRVGAELAVGSLLALVVIATRGSRVEMAAVTVFAVASLALSPVAHIMATRSGFEGARKRWL